MAPSPSTLLPVSRLPSSHLESLPGEIYLEIFSYFSDIGMSDEQFLDAMTAGKDREICSRAEFVNLCLVSKRMREVVEPFLYHTVIYRNVKFFGPRYSPALIKLLITLSTRPILSTYIRRIAGELHPEQPSRALSGWIPWTQETERVMEHLSSSEYVASAMQLLHILETTTQPLPAFEQRNWTFASPRLHLAHQYLQVNAVALSSPGLQLLAVRDLVIRTTDTVDPGFYPKLTCLCLEGESVNFCSLHTAIRLPKLTNLTIRLIQKDYYFPLHGVPESGVIFAPLSTLVLGTTCPLLLRHLGPACARLKTLRLYLSFGVAEQGPCVVCGRCKKSWSALLSQLHRHSTVFSTLRHLQLRMANSRQWDESERPYRYSVIGSLQHFSALKHLDMDQTCWQYPNNLGIIDFDDLLPSGLEKLTLYSRTMKINPIIDHLRARERLTALKTLELMCHKRTDSRRWSTRLDGVQVKRVRLTSRGEVMGSK